jgi:hypothetical protein
MTIIEALRKFAESIEDDAPCVAAIAAGLGMMFIEGDIKLVHRFADALAEYGVAAAEGPDPAVQILNALHVAEEGEE